MDDRAGGCAGTLTRGPCPRRIFDVRARAAAWLVLAAPVAAAAAVTGGVQPVGDIVSAAEGYLEARLAGHASGLVTRAGQLDPRLGLPRCDRALEGFLPAGGRIGRRTVVGVRCPGSRPWKVYVPVDVQEPRTVLVVRRSLPRGHVLTAADLGPEERDVSRLARGYLADATNAIGRRLDRRVLAGDVLEPSMLEEELLVQRGQSVTLVVESDALSVRMAGLALADGTRGERIRVRNLASDRVVEGVVRSAEQVEVLVP